MNNYSSMSRPSTQENPYQSHKLFKEESQEIIKLNDIEKKLDQYQLGSKVDKN